MTAEPKPAIIRFCLAEYCAGPFYMGWWLYERQTNDGRPNRDDVYPADGTSGGWGWMRGGCPRQQELHDLCVRMGHKPPLVERYRRQNFAEWFAATFPNGLRVRVHNGHLHVPERYELLEIMTSRPRQQPGCIRTIRGAARAKQRCRKEEARERRKAARKRRQTTR